MTYIDAYNILYRLYRQPDEYRTEAKQDDKQPNSIIIFIQNHNTSMHKPDRPKQEQQSDKSENRIDEDLFIDVEHAE